MPEPNDDGRGKPERTVHGLLQDPPDSDDDSPEELDHSQK